MDGTTFVPFATDDFGHIGDAGQALLEQLAERAVAGGRTDYVDGRTAAQQRASLLQRWRASITWAVLRGVDLSLERRVQCALSHTYQ